MNKFIKTYRLLLTAGLLLWGSIAFGQQAMTTDANGAYNYGTNSWGVGTGTNAFTVGGTYTADAAANALDYFYDATGTGTPIEITGAIVPDFYNLTFANGSSATAAITNTAGINVSGLLTFSNGISTTVRSNTATGAIRFLGTASYSGSVNNVLTTTTADAQHVNGYVNKRGNALFIFPVGSGTDARPLQISAPATATDEYSVAWMAGDPSSSSDPSDGNATHSTTAVSGPIVAVSPAGQWDWIAVSGTGAGLTVTVSIPDVSTFSLTTNLRLVGWNGSSWVDLSGGATATGGTENSTLSGTMAPGITAIGIGTVSTVLPVTLVSFTAVANGSCGADLVWTSATELNSSKYVVEYSTNGSSFTGVAEIVSKNNIAGASYSYTYNGPQSGAGYYRLKMVDKDGSVKYSSVVTATVSCSNAVVIAPNPVSTQFSVRGVSAGSFIEVYNNAGALLSSTRAVGGVQTISTQGYPSGTYLVRVVKDNTVIAVEKLIKK